MSKTKISKKIFLSLCVMIGLTLSFCTLKASAIAVDVATADDLIPYFTSGGEVRLADDITLSANASITGELTLDLNGHVLDMSNKTVAPFAHFTLMDSSEQKTGKITSTASFTVQIGASTSPADMVLESGTIDCGGAYCVRNYGNFTMNGGKIIGKSFVVYNQGDFTLNAGTVTATTGTAVRSSSDGVVFIMNGGKVETLGDAVAINLAKPDTKFIMNDGVVEALYTDGGTRGGNAIIAFRDAEVTINNGTIIATGSAVMGNGSGPESGANDGSNAKFNVNGGTITSTSAAGMYLPQINGLTTITGGLIEGLTGIEIRGGKLIVTGGTIIGNGEYETTSNANGLTTKGSSISVAQHTSEQPVDVYISGGEFNAYAPISFTNPLSHEQEVLDKVTITIVGGGYEGEDYDAVIENIANGYVDLDRTTGGFVVTVPSENIPQEEDLNVLVPDTGKFTVLQNESVKSSVILCILSVVMLVFATRFVLRAHARYQRHQNILK